MFQIINTAIVASALIFTTNAYSQENSPLHLDMNVSEFQAFVSGRGVPARHKKNQDPQLTDDEKEALRTDKKKLFKVLAKAYREKKSGIQKVYKKLEFKDAQMNARKRNHIEGNQVFPTRGDELNAIAEIGTKESSDFVKAEFSKILEKAKKEGKVRELLSEARIVKPLFTISAHKGVDVHSILTTLGSVVRLNDLADPKNKGFYKDTLAYNGTQTYENSPLKNNILNLIYSMRETSGNSLEYLKFFNYLSKQMLEKNSAYQKLASRTNASETDYQNLILVSNHVDYVEQMCSKLDTKKNKEALDACDEAVMLSKKLRALAEKIYAATSFDSSNWGYARMCRDIESMENTCSTHLVDGVITETLGNDEYIDVVRNLCSAPAVKHCTNLRNQGVEVTDRRKQVAEFIAKTLRYTIGARNDSELDKNTPVAGHIEKFNKAAQAK